LGGFKKVGDDELLFGEEVPEVFIEGGRRLRKSTLFDVRLDVGLGEELGLGW